MDDRIGAAQRGENPTVILQMKSGFAVIGDYQYLPGYCVLIASPRADSLNDLTLAQRTQFLQDMALVGDAVDAVCSPAKLNYAIMMNQYYPLHAHIQARYAWEPEEYRTGPVSNYPQSVRSDPQCYYAAEKNLALLSQLQAALSRRLDETGYWEADDTCR